MGRLLAAASAVVSLVSVFGCTEQDSCPAVCERATLTSRLVSGQITFATGDAPAETRAFSHDEFGSGAPGGCVVGHLQSEVFRDESVNSAGPSVHCDLGTGYLWLDLEAVRDPRSLTVGTHAVTPSPATPLIEVQRSGCLTRGTSGLFTVDVTNAAGGAAPYPMLITGDYARDFSVHVETVSDTTFTGDCTPTSAVLDVSLTQAASDAVFDPKAECPCE